MSQEQYIDIEITEDGEIVSEVVGVLGPDCEGLAHFLKDLGVVVEDRRTPDYTRQQARTNRVRAGAGR